MGLIFVGVLAGILIGCGLLAPSLARFEECPPQGCFSRSIAAESAELRSAALNPSPAIMKVEHASPAKPKKPPPAKTGKRIDLAKTIHAPARTHAPPDRPAETSDAVLSKAKISIATKLEDPASAEFGDMKRAIRKNMFGRPVDTICGHVKGKNASGEDTGERPFLYLVKEDDAYVVDGKENSAAAIAYRNICN